MGAARHGAIIQPLLEWNGQLFLSLVLVIGGYQALVGGVPLAALIQFLFLSNGAVRGDPEPRQPVQPGAGGDGGRRARVRAARHAPRLGGRARRRRRSSASRAASSCDGVGFAYEPGPSGAARDVDLARAGRAAPSRWSAPTGSGKSTLASLVAKLYLPTAGELSVDGRDLAGVSGPSLRRHIACVTQDNFLYSGTVADNIRVGRPGRQRRRGARGGARARRRGS